MTEHLFTTTEAGTYLGISRDSVLRHIHAGAIRTVNVGTATRPRLRIRPVDLDAFVDSRASQV